MAPLPQRGRSRGSLLLSWGQGVPQGPAQEAASSESGGRGQHPGGCEQIEVPRAFSTELDSVFVNPAGPVHTRLSPASPPLLQWFKCILVIISLIRAKAVCIHPLAKNSPAASQGSQLCSEYGLGTGRGLPSFRHSQDPQPWATTPRCSQLGSPCPGLALGPGYLSQVLTVHKALGVSWEPKRPLGPCLKLRSPHPV